MSDTTPETEEREPLAIVFAQATAVVSHPHTGTAFAVNHGTHWPADDALVLAYPHFFTDDPRYGLSSSDPLDDEGYPVRLTRSGGKDETTSSAPGERRRRR